MVTQVLYVHEAVTLMVLLLIPRRRSMIHVEEYLSVALSGIGAQLVGRERSHLRLDQSLQRSVPTLWLKTVYSVGPSSANPRDEVREQRRRNNRQSQSGSHRLFYLLSALNIFDFNHLVLLSSLS
jgi:hypothetical protein